jgi:hypothetical protein
MQVNNMVKTQQDPDEYESINKSRAHPLEAARCKASTRTPWSSFHDLPSRGDICLRSLGIAKELERKQADPGLK